MIRRVDEQSSNGTMDKTARAVVSGSRLFNTVFGLPCNAENITRSLGTFQSGSPPGRTTINRRGNEDRRFSTGSRDTNSYIDSAAPMPTFNSLQSIGTWIMSLFPRC